MAVLVAKNVKIEGPGRLAEVMAEKGIDYKVINLYDGERFPNPKDYDAVIVMGGTHSANDRTAMMRDELKGVQRTLEEGIPFLGTCLGMQVAVKAAGGKVVRNDVPEIGWYDPSGKPFIIALTDQGKSDSIFDGIPPRIQVFHLHGETVALTSSMALLATGEHCNNQVVRIGSNAYGIQGHLEIMRMNFDNLLMNDPELSKLPHGKLQADYTKAMRSHAAGWGFSYNIVAERTFENFFRIAGLIR
jgi:GMP synthase (glutamine-hydrolysing)